MGGAACSTSAPPSSSRCTLILSHATKRKYESTRNREVESAGVRNRDSTRTRMIETPDPRSLRSPTSFVVSQRDPPDADIGVSTDPERRDV